LHKIWVVLIVGALVVGVLALSGGWKQIPYISDLIWDSGITVPLNNAQTTIMDTIRSNPQALLGMTGAAVTGSVALLKTFKTRITEFREARQLASETLGGITENFNTLKTDYDKLVGEKDELIQEVGDLKAKLDLQTEQYGNVQNVIDAKNEEIDRLRQQTDDLHEVIRLSKLGEDEAIVKTVVL
jgi:chromosome segregation ATPase